MAEPASPGWQPDPERAGVLRWWNGLGWSDARKPVVGGPVVPVAAPGAAGPAAVPVPIPPSTVRPASVPRVAVPSTVPPGRPATVPGRAARTSNPVSTVGLVLAIVSVVAGFIPVLPPIALFLSVAGIARSRALARLGVGRTGLVRSVVGLLLSLGALALWGSAFLQVFRS